MRRVAERRDQERKRVALRRVHAQRRVWEVLAWPAGIACPGGRLREAWVAYRWSVDAIARSGSALAGRWSDPLASRTRQAIQLYEQFTAERPPGWPIAGPAALLALAGQQRAESLAGDVARLLTLAKQMRAAALERDARRAARQAQRARHRASNPEGPIRYRPPRAVRWESPEHRRQRVRDEVLMAGDDPVLWPNAALALERLPRRAAPVLTGPDRFEALDGIGARSARYRHELRRGTYRLVAELQQLTPSPES